MLDRVIPHKTRQRNFWWFPKFCLDETFPMPLVRKQLISGLRRLNLTTNTFLKWTPFLGWQYHVLNSGIPSVAPPDGASQEIQGTRKITMHAFKSIMYKNATQLTYCFSVAMNMYIYKLHLVKEPLWNKNFTECFSFSLFSLLFRTIWRYIVFSRVRRDHIWCLPNRLVTRKTYAHQK